MSKKQPKEVRIETILDAAVEEFLLKGYDGASIDGIAKRAGVSKGGFYHHFSNKEVLLMEANRKLSEPIMIIAEKACNCESAYAGLSIYVKEYLKYWMERPRELSFFFLSMSKALESEILMEYYKDYMKASTDFFTHIFQKAYDIGETCNPDTEMMGISLMGALDGVLTYLITNSNMDIDIFAERLEKIWIDK
jgi:AcrR family transcriptional regulator